MSLKPDILCVGSVLWDVIGRSDGDMSTGDDVKGQIFRQPGGVALNLAVRLRKYKILSEILSAVGNDSEGRDLLEFLNTEGIICQNIFKSKISKTDVYMAIEVENEVISAIADTQLLEAEASKILANLLAGPYGEWNTPIVLDSNLPNRVLTSIRHSQKFLKSEFMLVPASPSKVDRLRVFLDHPGSIFYLNLREANSLVKSDFKFVEDAGKAVLELGAKSTLITNGPQKACYMCGETIITATPPEVRVRKLTGAGDVLMAAHIASQFLAKDPYDSLMFSINEASEYISEEFNYATN